MKVCPNCGVAILVFPKYRDGYPNLPFCSKGCIKALTPVWDEHAVYKSALAELRAAPTDQVKKQRVLELGTRLIATAREFGTFPLFDARSLTKNLESACAAAELAAYEQAIAELKTSPNDPEARERALAAGRARAATGRLFGAVTIFDETALANDLEAACAADNVVLAAVPSTSDDISTRLKRLESLLEANLITEDEYQIKRTALLEEL